MHFLDWKLVYFAYDFTETYSPELNQRYVSIGSDNGLVPERQQAIIWTNAVLVYWCIYPLHGLGDLTHWGRVTHICVSKQTIIGSDNSLSPDQRQAIILWTNAGILLIRTLEQTSVKY